MLIFPPEQNKITNYLHGRVSYLQDDDNQIGHAITKMPTKDELVVFRFCFKPNILLPDKSKDHGKNEHQGLEEDDGKITCGVHGVRNGGNRVRRADANSAKKSQRNN